MSRVSPACLLAAGLAACTTPYLVPLAPGGQVPPEGTVVRAAGLALTALPAAWPGYPQDLPRAVTPLSLIVANEGEAPAPVRFEDFLLLDGGMREYRALSPLEVVTILYGSAALPRPVVVPARRPGVRWRGVGVGIRGPVRVEERGAEKPVEE
ncbi:MAG: hypothetical protein HYT86_02565, partial [candidate division NC10 bacterium]|nr:hypothetical protein [candidate division NC10 bacterium]